MSSNAEAHARQKSVKIKTTTSAELAVEIIQENRPHVFLIDLQTPGLVIDQLGEMIKELADSVCPLTIAYAQHVNVELLDAGKTAGFDQVLTRGQLNSQISQIVADAV